MIALPLQNRLDYRLRDRVLLKWICEESVALVEPFKERRLGVALANDDGSHLWRIVRRR